MARGCIAPECLRPEKLERITCDIAVVGAGIAGMTAALSLDPGLEVALLSKASFTASSTYKAQGGIAVAVGADDSAADHIADTLRVGQGMCREEAVHVLVREGPAALEYLQSLGAAFTRAPGGLDLTREAGHSRRRVVHYHDHTGRHIAETLAAAAARRGNIELLDDSFLVDIITDRDGCRGCVVEQGGRLLYLDAAAVVVATGGYSGLFLRSTNEASAGGDGIAAAYRAGAALADMEFVQFHPTAATLPSGKVFLLTEALRGEGAVLLNRQGERFMAACHPDGELAPRDEVARAILRESARQGGGPVYLDATRLGRRHLTERFRHVYGELAKSGWFLDRDAIPVLPAAHYTIGGIKTDLWGRSTVPSLYACGEAAATGVHGANRLASNSLLEGVVFARRTAAHINGSRRAPRPAGRFPADAQVAAGVRPDLPDLRARLEAVAGVVRRGEELAAALAWLRAGGAGVPVGAADRHACHAVNACQLAELLLAAALLRAESRGAHYREDYPARNDGEFSNHTLQQWGRKAVME
ncbi:L-aspartate oxidase [Anaeroselena agilis]|uniref:L-aspartate oxidase n=1 Tax=Anaeroselena agilis TaxID=3063788 RepID=A0ABU3P044_9FIRM|nr:L-aspartate oxidase [Selenomonadales bacterium 4137-cl]